MNDRSAVSMKVETFLADAGRNKYVGWKRRVERRPKTFYRNALLRFIRVFRISDLAIMKGSHESVPYSSFAEPYRCTKLIHDSLGSHSRSDMQQAASAGEEVSYDESADSVGPSFESSISLGPEKELMTELAKAVSSQGIDTWG